MPKVAGDLTLFSSKTPISGNALTLQGTYWSPDPRICDKNSICRMRAHVDSWLVREQLMLYEAD